MTESKLIIAARQKAKEWENKLEGIIKDYPGTVTSITDAPDLTPEGRTKQIQEAYANAESTLDSSTNQALKELGEFKSIVANKLEQTKKQNMEASTSTDHRMKVEQVKEELAADLFALGPGEFYKHASDIAKGDNRLSKEAIRALLPQLQASFDRYISANELPQSEHNIVVANLAELARSLNSSLQPEEVQATTAELEEIQSLIKGLEVTADFQKRLLAKQRPATPWPPA